MEKYICVHGHFYQPPRENPWLESIELQDSAYPYHDWNRRVTAECYEPNGAARILGPDMKIIRILNNYSKMSFNFGPTLLYNMRSEKPESYEAIIRADKESRGFFSGHGSALAQVYNHMIMPLASKRDKHTQVYWGIKDFRSRFGRDPEGMWLPETAADTESLEALAEQGIKFTILAPRQAKRVKKILKGARWKDLTGEIDPTAPYVCNLPSGRSIALFFYDGAISHEVGFGNLLDNGEAFARRLASAFPEADRPSALVHIATDGESYGHHHRHGDMALSYCLYFIESQGLAKLTNYGEYLEKSPPDHIAEIHDNSSWSCVHGIERWRNDCGCNAGGHPGWNQKWRAPLREAFDWLRDNLAGVYEQEASKYLKDPWAARDDYIDVINDRSVESVERFFGAHARDGLSKEERIKALKLLGVQRNALLMYSSCGWFFDEVSGIETVQVMQYASRALQLTEEVAGVSLEDGFLKLLEKAPSNLYENAATAYRNFARPARVDLLRVGAHHAISSLFQEHARKTSIYSFTAECEFYEKIEAGKITLAVGRTRINSRITWEEAQLASAVLHLGETNITCGIKYLQNEDELTSIEAELKSTFDKGDIPEVIRLIDKHFGRNNYSLWHLFRDEQRKIINEILQATYKEIEDFHRRVFETNYGTMDFLRKLQIPLPRPLGVSSEFILNLDLIGVLEEDELDLEALGSLIKKAQHLMAHIDPDTIGYVASAWVNRKIEDIMTRPPDLEAIERARDALKLLRSTPAKLNLWKAQNIYFSAGRMLLSAEREKADKGDEVSRKWVEAFDDLGNQVHVKIS